MMAGPCSVESRDQLFETADSVKAAGATILRGGAFKPRTSPYAFQGLGVEALTHLAEGTRARPACRIVTEVMEPNRSTSSVEYADILQIGTRNMQNFSLLQRGRARRTPGAAEAGLRGDARRVADGRRVHPRPGQPERHPVRARHPHRSRPTARNTLDLVGRPAAPRPVAPADHRRPEPRDREAGASVKPLADRRHRRRGRRRDGRGPPRPDEALSDAEQQLTLAQFDDLMAAIVPVRRDVRGMAGDPFEPDAALTGGDGLSKH